MWVIPEYRQEVSVDSNDTLAYTMNSTKEV